MKPAVVVLVCVVIAGCTALDGKLQEEDASTTVPVEYTTVTSDPLDLTEGSMTEDDSIETNGPSDPTATVQPETSVTASSPKVTSTDAGQDTTTTTASQSELSTPSGLHKRLSTEVDKSKCESLGIKMPNADGCKCYKQKSAGTDTPQGYCFYYECAGTPPTLSNHKCEWIKE